MQLTGWIGIHRKAWNLLIYAMTTNVDWVKSDLLWHCWWCFEGINRCVPDSNRTKALSFKSEGCRISVKFKVIFFLISYNSVDVFQCQIFKILRFKSVWCYVHQSFTEWRFQEKQDIETLSKLHVSKLLFMIKVTWTFLKRAIFIEEVVIFICLLRYCGKPEKHQIGCKFLVFSFICCRRWLFLFSKFSYSKSLTNSWVFASQSTSDLVESVGGKQEAISPNHTASMEKILFGLLLALGFQGKYGFGRKRSVCCFQSSFSLWLVKSVKQVFCCLLAQTGYLISFVLLSKSCLHRKLINLTCPCLKTINQTTVVMFCLLWSLGDLIVLLATCYNWSLKK